MHSFQAINTNCIQVHQPSLQVARHVIFNLIMTRGAEKQGPIHQWKLLKYWEGAVAQGAVHNISVAGTER